MRSQIVFLSLAVFALAEPPLGFHSYGLPAGPGYIHSDGGFIGTKPAVNKISTIVQLPASSGENYFPAGTRGFDRPGASVPSLLPPSKRVEILVKPGQFGGVGGLGGFGELPAGISGSYAAPYPALYRAPYPASIPKISYPYAPAQLYGPPARSYVAPKITYVTPKPVVYPSAPVIAYGPPAHSYVAPKITYAAPKAAIYPYA